MAARKHKKPRRRANGRAPSRNPMASALRSPLFKPKKKKAKRGKGAYTRKSKHGEAADDLPSE